MALGTTVTELLTTGPEAGADIRVQLREAFDGLVRDAEPDVLTALASILPLLRELTTRRR